MVRKGFDMGCCVAWEGLWMIGEELGWLGSDMVIPRRSGLLNSRLLRALYNHLNAHISNTNLQNELNK